MNRRERKKEITKDNIIDCAVSLFKEKGFRETYIEEISERADVSKGTVYNYFQDKESILAAYFQSIVADYSNENSGRLKDSEDIKVQLNQILDFENNIFRSDIDLATIYFKYRLQSLFNDNPFDNPQRSGLESLILQVIKDAQNKNQIRTDIPSEIMARNFQILYMNYFISSIYENEAFDVTTIKSQIIDLYINGTKAQKIILGENPS